MTNGKTRIQKPLRLGSLLAAALLAAALPVAAQAPAAGSADACASIGTEVELGNCLSDLRGALEKVVRDSAAGIKLTDEQKTALTGTCKTQKKPGSTADETPAETETRCRKDALAPLVEKWLEPIDKAVTTELIRQAGLIRASKQDDTQALQRLQNVLDDRQAAIKNALKPAVKAVVDGIKLNLTAPEKLQDVVVKRTEDALGTLATKVAEGVTVAIKAWQSKILAAHTPSDEFKLNEKRREEFQSKAEQAALDEIRNQKREGFIRRIMCAWIDPSANPEPSAVNVLACGDTAGLKVSGEEISKVIVTGIPVGATIKVGTGEITNSGPETAEYGSLSEATVELGENTTVVVVLHKKKTFGSTIKGNVPVMGYPEIARLLRGSDSKVPCDPGKTSVIQLLTRGRSPSLEIVITVGIVTKTASIPLGYSRWKFETGGFMAVTTAVDEKVVKRASTDPTKPGQMVIDRVRKADDYVQETGIFANFIPENYQKLGFGLGFATNDGGPPSAYLSVNMRLTTFGNRGLASVGGGIALRSVARYPDLESRLEETAGLKDASGNPVQLVLPPDSSLLLAERQQEVGWFIGISLGFRFGPIGAPDDGN